MKAEELRIGNVVLHKKTIVKINDIGRAWHTHRVLPIEKFSAPSRKCRVKEYSPIPLTEEILLDCGFEKTYGLRFQIDDILMLDMGDLTAGINPYDIFWIGDCKYVNQLQNLYFALTGQELEFKTLGKNN